MKIHTIQLHIGDLQGGTNHMDATEFGAYMALILCAYQAKDHRLPDDDSRLCRMAKCTPKIWARIKPIIMAKFTLSDSFWEHETVNRNAECYSQKSQKNKNNALKRYNSALPVAGDSQCQTPAIQYPIPNIQYPVIKKQTKKADVVPTSEFESFWAVYPQKANKAEAMKSYTRALKEVPRETIIDGAIAYAEFCRRSGKEERFICHASTWLNGKRWANNYASMDAGPAGAHVSPKPFKRGLAALEDAGDDLLQQIGMGGH